jgi:hypothetical protein
VHDETSFVIVMPVLVPRVPEQVRTKHDRPDPQAATQFCPALLHCTASVGTKLYVDPTQHCA